MDLSIYEDRWTFDESHGCYCLEQVVYCRDAVAPELQCMNIYVPEPYMGKNGKVNINGKCGVYTAKSAPIILENCIGGYSECSPRFLTDPKCTGEQFIKSGMIYVTVGARGKQTKDSEGRFIGKSPAGLVDVKCAIRFLRHNRDIIAGQTERIISIGVSAGGAISALLGCTGDSRNYTHLIEAAGGIMEESDRVYAAQCYCPIIDLEHADIAYEWMFQGVYESEGMRGCGGSTFNGFQESLSQLLAQKYITYFNQLKLYEPITGLPLTLGQDGRSGTAYVYLMGIMEQAAKKYLELLEKGKLSVTYSLDEYMSGQYRFVEKKPSLTEGGPPVLEEVSGSDKHSWLQWDGKNVKIKGLDYMWGEYAKRLKPCTAFDDFDMRQSENQEFGDEKTDCVHFDSYIADALECLKGEFPTEYQRYHDEFIGLDKNLELQRRIYLLNPFNYIGTDEIAELSPYYRIRVGTRDSHTSFTMAMILALKLEACDCTDVDYAMIWDGVHENADYEGELCQWIGRIVSPTD